MMRAIRVLFFLFLAGTACAYWTNLRRASISITVYDDGRLHSDRLHDVSLQFFDEKGHPLARARTVEPLGYYVVIHPDPATGDCRQYEYSGTRGEFGDCVERQTYWISTWAERVATASFAWAGCTIPSAPVHVTTSTSEWWFWWLLFLTDGPYVPYRSIVLEIDVNAAEACVGEQSRHRPSNTGWGIPRMTVDHPSVDLERKHHVDLHFLLPTPIAVLLASGSDAGRTTVIPNELHVCGGFVTMDDESDWPPTAGRPKTRRRLRCLRSHDPEMGDASRPRPSTSVSANS